MRGKKRIGLLFLLIAVVVGGGGLLLAQKALHKTSDTAFCLSCHSMSKPFEEYQGTVHFSNQKGIRAECADCHIPKSGMDYLFAKLKASKDIYHEFVSGKIDSDDKFEAHRQEMAETVWKELKATDSAYRQEYSQHRHQYPRYKGVRPASAAASQPTCCSGYYLYQPEPSVSAGSLHSGLPVSY